MDKIDLDINHYSYTDLLALFKLDDQFTEHDLKLAKRIVLQTHPDKSGLDKDVFLFFSQAYKLIYSVYKMVHHKPSLDDLNRPIQPDMYVDKHTQKQYQAFATSKEFHIKFNEIFEKIKNHSSKYEDNDDGYETWLKSATDDLNMNAHSVQDMNTIIEHRKKQLRQQLNQQLNTQTAHTSQTALIQYNTLKDIGSGCSSTISSNTYLTRSIQKQEEPDYSSNVFDPLRYEDVKKAYTETVVPVSHEDYINRPKYTSIHQYQMHRDRENIEYASHENLDSHQEKYNQFKKQEQLQDNHKAFELAIQAKRNEEYRKYVNSHFLRLTNT
jgi:hypothetical protein